MDRVSQKAQQLASAALVVIALSVTTVTLTVLYISHWHGPFRDMWEIFPFLEKIIDGSWGWQDLWGVYGYSHRLLIPKLLFIADYHWSDASNHLLISVSLICQTAICWIFWMALKGDKNISPAAVWALLAIVVITQFSGTQLFNLLHTFDVQWFLVCLLISMALYALVLKEAYLLSAIFIAMACLCNFSAVAGWPIWFGMLAINKRFSRKNICILVLSVVFIILISADIRSLDWSHNQGASLPFMTFYLLGYFPLLYLSSPISDPDFLATGSFGVIISALALAYLVIFFYSYLIKRHEKSSASLFFACIALFGFGVSLLTGVGRGYDHHHVFALRYQNIVMLFWAGVIPFLWLEAKCNGRWLKLVSGFCGICFVSGILVCQLTAWNQHLLLGRNVHRSHLALMMGYSHDVPMIAATVSRSMIYVVDYNLEKERALHERSRKGIYDGRTAHYWLNGVERNSIDKVCQNVHWQLRPKQTPYTQFVSFTVTGEAMSAYDSAILINNDDQAVAVATLDKPSTVSQLWQHLSGARQQVLRGFSRVNSAQDLRLLLVSGNEKANDCLGGLPGY